MRTLNIILTIVVIIGSIIVGFMMADKLAYGQNATTTLPQAVTPPPVNTPTPTAPTPNLQYLPQKSYIQTFVPESGVPTALPATSVPQYTNQSGGSGFPDIASIISVVMGAAGLGYAKIVGNKTNKVAETTQQQSEQIVQSKEVEHSLAKQVYEIMPDKGASINDKPEIKLEKLADNKEEAVKTATKA